MVRRLIQLVKDKIIGNKKNGNEKLQEVNKKQNWEKRKAELLTKARRKTSVNKPKSHNSGPNKTEVTAVKKHSEGLPKTKDNHAKNTKRKKENSSQLHGSDKPKRKYTDKKEGASKSHSKKEKVIKPHDWNTGNFKVDPIEGKTRFHDLNLRSELMHSIFEAGFQYCTPIQEAILKSTLEGKDATGKAQTGTGKTAAFLITIINKFLLDPPTGVRRPGAPRALILAPTRELVMQIASDAKILTKYTNISVVEIYGGMDYHKQQRRLRGNSIDILAATPGRLLDFQHKRDVFLGSVETLVIDEADRMLDMGFIPDVRKIINSTPSKSKRQTLFLSATLNAEVIRLAKLWTKDAVNVEIEPENVAGTSVNQIVYIVSNNEKFSLLFNVIQKQKLEKVLVFANRKDEAHPLQEQLKKSGVSCEVLSGDVDQKKRIRTLNNFKEGKIRVLVATDVASRGIHVEDISHVINYTLPQDPEDYVHRIGRTGRAGAVGTSISFASEDDSFYIPAIEKFLGNKLNCVYPEDELLITPLQDKTGTQYESEKPEEHEENINPSREENS